MEVKFAALHRSSATPEQQVYWRGIPSEVEVLYMTYVKGQYVRVCIELPNMEEMFFLLTLSVSSKGLHYYHKTLRQEEEILYGGRGIEDTALDAMASSFRSINPLDPISLKGDGAFLAFIRQQKGAPVDTCFTDLL